MPKSTVQSRTTGHTGLARGSEVRRRLLAAAVELVPEVGWERVSTRMLAERAGVAPGLVHYHFASVDDVLRQAALGVGVELVTTMGGALSDEVDLDDGLRGLLAFLDPYTGADPTSLLFLEAYLASTRDLELQRELAKLVAGFTGELTRWLTVHGVPDAEATAAVLAAAVDGVMLHRTLNPHLTAAAVLPLVRRMLLAEPAVS